METKDLTSGMLNYPIRLSGRVKTGDQVDDMGLPIKSYIEREASLWAHKEEMQASEKAELVQDISAQLVKFYCRTFENISRDDEIECQGQKYAIVSISKEPEWMTIVCKAVENG